MVKSIDNRKLVREGSHVVVKQDVPDEILTAKDVLLSIGHFESALDKNHQDLAQLEELKQKNLEGIEFNQNALKQLKYHEEWALEVQESLCKNIIKEVFDECKKLVDDTYKEDKALNEEQNAMQKYKQLQMKIATHKRIKDEVASVIYKKLCFTESVIQNPWITEK